jgi:hypothetical protein
MTKLAQAFVAASLTAAALSPLAAHADYSKCTGKIRSMGYHILDVDSDWGRPNDKFSAVKNGREYDIWVDKKSCKIVHTQLDDDRRYYDD